MTINPVLFDAHVAEQLPTKGNILDFGLVEVNNTPVFAKGDTRWRVSHIKSLDQSGDESTLDGSDLVPEMIDNYAEYGVIVRRTKLWASTEFGNVPAGVEPLQVVAPQVAGYAARQIQKNLAAATRGAFATALNNVGHVSDATAATITASAIIDGKALVGENGEMMTTALLHSKQYADLQKQGLVNWVNASTYGEQILRTGQIPTVMGLRVQVSDDFCAPLHAVLKVNVSGAGVGSITVIHGGKGYTQASGAAVTITATKLVNGVRTAIAHGATATATIVSGVVTAIVVTAAGSGLNVTADEGLQVTATVLAATPIYPAYVCGNNCFALGYQKGLNLKQGEDLRKGGGTEYLKISTHYVPHVKGVSYVTGSPENPSLLLLQDPTAYAVANPDATKILIAQVLTK